MRCGALEETGEVSGKRHWDEGGSIIDDGLYRVEGIPAYVCFST